MHDTFLSYLHRGGWVAIELAGSRDVVGIGYIWQAGRGGHHAVIVARGVRQHVVIVGRGVGQYAVAVVDRVSGGYGR